MGDKVECPMCDYKLSKKELKICERIDSKQPECFCSMAKEINNKNNKIIELKKEISNLNGILSEADESGWDHEGMYEDAFTGTFNGNNIGGSPDKKYAKWLAERYGLKIDKEGDVIRD